MNKNSTRIIFTPLIIALVLLLGIFIGQKFSGSKVGYQPILQNMGSSKIDKVLQLIKSDYVDTVSLKKLEETAIANLLEELDPHSVYIPAKQFNAVNDPLQGSFVGIGIQFNILHDTVMVVNTISGGPAETAGLRAGDRIIKVNDSTFVGKDMNSKKVTKYLKGKEDTKVRLTVVRSHFPKDMEFELTRKRIALKSLDVSYMLEQNIGYIKLSQFARTSHEEFKNAVKKLKKKGMKKLIVDLRSNGGGYLDIAINIADEFLKDKKLIVYTKGRSRPRNEYFASTRGICEDLPVGILIDSYSASASEILAGALQDNDRSVIIGRRSFGKGLVQEPVRMQDGSALRLTTARYYTPTGRGIQKPYKNNQDYELDILNRIKSGELENKDSIKVTDTLKFITPAGKVVYGGGGITPDIFVPRDTSVFTDYFIAVQSKSLIYEYAFDFSDKHREKLETFKNYNSLEDYLNQQNIFEKFADFAKEKGVKKDGKNWQDAKQFIANQVKAYISRNIFDNDGFYPIFQKFDSELNKAIEIMKNQNKTSVSIARN